MEHLSGRQTIIDRLDTLGGGFFIRRGAMESRVAVAEAWRVYEEPVFVWIRSDDFNDNDIEIVAARVRGVPHLQGVRLSGTQVTKVGVDRLRRLLPGIWVEGVLGS